MAIVRAATSTASTVARLTTEHSNKQVLAAARVTAVSGRSHTTPAPRCFGTFRKLFGGASNSSGSDKKLKGKNADLIRRATFAMAGTQLAPTSPPDGQDIATFAGGCFWGLELAYQRMPGVTHTSVGYTAGKTESPTYQEVCSGSTGHAEAVQVYFDPKEVSYDQLLDQFFDKVDPTTLNQQGNDRGTQYRSAIYYHSEAQKEAASKAIEEVNKKLSSSVFRRVMGSKVVTELTPFDGKYWLAEDYHQQYLEKGGQNASKGATERIRCYG